MYIYNRLLIAIATLSLMNINIYALVMVCVRLVELDIIDIEIIDHE